jgi:hypothetical protein
MLERLVRDKHPSLLGPFVIYGDKSIANTDPDRVEQMKVGSKLF